MENNEKNLKLTQSTQIITDAMNILQRVNDSHFIVAKLDANSNTKVTGLGIGTRIIVSETS